MATQGMHNGGSMGQVGHGRQADQGLGTGVSNIMPNLEAMLQVPLLQQAQGPGTISPALQPGPALPPDTHGSPYSPQFGMTMVGSGSSPTPSPAQRVVPSPWISRMGSFVVHSTNPATPTPSMVQASPALGQVGSPMVSSPLAQMLQSSQVLQSSQPSQLSQSSTMGYTGVGAAYDASVLSLQAMLLQQLQQPQLPHQPTIQQANQFSWQMLWHQQQFQQMLQLAHSQAQTSQASNTQGDPGNGPSGIGLGPGPEQQT